MSIARKILSNTAAQFFGKLLMAAMGLFVVKLSTNYLSVSGYGEYVLVYEFLAFFGIAADLGLFTIAVKEMSEDESKIEKIIGNVLSIRSALVVIMMGVAILSAFLVPKYHGTRIPLGVAIASLTVILTILNGTISSVLQTKLKMHIASFASVLGKLISVLTMLYIVFFAFKDDTTTGFFMLLVAGVIGSLITFLITFYYTKKITAIKYRFDSDLWKDILVKSLPYGIAIILNTIYFRIDSILISLIRGPKEVGIYGVPMKMLEQFSVLPLYFMNSVLPVLTSSIKKKQDNYKKIIKYSFDFLAAMAIPLVVGGFVLAYPITFVVSSPEFLSNISEGFYGSDIAFKILIFALFFQFLNVLFAFILISVNKQSKLLKINAICVVFNVITNLIFIPVYGFIGAAITSVLSEIFILIASFHLAKKHLKFSIDLTNLVKIIVSALVMGFVVNISQTPLYHFMENWSIIVLVILGIFIYTLMLFITRVIDKDMYRILLKNKIK